MFPPACSLTATNGRKERKTGETESGYIPRGSVLSLAVCLTDWFVVKVHKLILDRSQLRRRAFPQLTCNQLAVRGWPTLPLSHIPRSLQTSTVTTICAKMYFSDHVELGAEKLDVYSEAAPQCKHVHISGLSCPTVQKENTEQTIYRWTFAIQEQNSLVSAQPPLMITALIQREYLPHPSQVGLLRWINQSHAHKKTDNQSKCLLL